MTISPISAREFSDLMAPLGPFEPAPRIAVAVSGGADSMALALLASHWAEGWGGRAVALTVDHGLRPASAGEARQGAQWLRSRGIEHVTLPWTGAKPSAGIQAAARAARYRLLEDWCAGQGVLHLLLAHHLEDQAETLLLRLGRGSGLDGLSAMAPLQETRDLRLLRPLLGTSSARLKVTLKGLDQPWIEDPSNRNPAFARVRIRRMLPDLAAEGLTASRLAETAARMGRDRAVLDEAVAEAALEHVMLHPAGFATASAEAFARLPNEIAMRLVTRLVLAVGGGQYAPRRERMERLAADLKAGLGGQRTLGGCVVAPRKGGVIAFCREPARVSPPAELLPGQTVVWDNRFRVCLASEAPASLTVGAWGKGAPPENAGIDPRNWASIPLAARQTLPVIYDKDGICVMPYLGYNRGAKAERGWGWILASPANPLTVAGRCLV